MPAITNATNAMPAADIEALDAALADFDLEGDDEIIEGDLPLEGDEFLVEAGSDADAEVVETTATTLDHDELADLELTLERVEAYATQDAGPAIADVTGEAPAKPAKAKKAAKASSGTKSAAVRTPRDIKAVADEFFVLAGDPATMSGDDLAAARASTMALMPSQVKVAEKFDNLFTALSVGKHPSRFTMIAFEALNTKGTLTSGELIAAYKAVGLGEGTARSQSGQLMNLLSTLGIATRSGQSLTLRPESLLAERIRNLPAANVA